MLLDWSLTSGTGRRETAFVRRENTDTLKINPFAVRSATKVGGNGNSESPRLRALLLLLLFPDVLVPAVLVPKSPNLAATPGLDFLPLSAPRDFREVAQAVLPSMGLLP